VIRQRRRATDVLVSEGLRWRFDAWNGAVKDQIFGDVVQLAVAERAFPALELGRLARYHDWAV
jgi:hypothetical protein